MVTIHTWCSYTYTHVYRRLHKIQQMVRRKCAQTSENRKKSIVNVKTSKKTGFLGCSCVFFFVFFRISCCRYHIRTHLGLECCWFVLACMYSLDVLAGLVGSNFKIVSLCVHCLCRLCSFHLLSLFIWPCFLDIHNHLFFYC